MLRMEGSVSFLVLKSEAPEQVSPFSMNIDEGRIRSSSEKPSRPLPPPPGMVGGVTPPGGIASQRPLIGGLGLNMSPMNTISPHQTPPGMAGAQAVSSLHMGGGIGSHDIKGPLVIFQTKDGGKNWNKVSAF